MIVNWNMIPLRIYPEVEVTDNVGFSGLDDGQKDMLNRLRMGALDCRSAARADLFEACAVLSSSPQNAKNAYIETLMRCLPEALGKTPVLFRPSVEQISFDEAWLLRAVEAAAQDRDSFEFLIRSRVPHVARRNLGSLLTGISKKFGRT